MDESAAMYRYLPSKKKKKKKHRKKAWQCRYGYQLASRLKTTTVNTCEILAYEQANAAAPSDTCNVITMLILVH